MIFREIAVNMLLDLYDTSTRLIADAGAITTPLLMLAAGSDWVVDVGAQRKFFERASSTVKQFEMLPGFSHAVFHEKERKQVVDKVRAFVLDRFAQPSAPPSLLDADRRGYTFDEYERPFRLASRSLIGMDKLEAYPTDQLTLGWRSKTERCGRTAASAC